MAIQRPPDHWDDRQKYFYRKLAGLNNQPLIDKLQECLDIYRGRKFPNPPYTFEDIVRMAKVITHILENERDVDIDLAIEDFNRLEKEMSYP